jgi:Asp-tRNA(Asn)/Glu-tRNA(Gln) amidotransferase A subunit family amidase
VFGLKPSLGRIPIDPPYYGRVAGPMTRNVMDAALMMRELAKPDWRDSMSLPAADIPWLDLGIAVKGLRIGLMMEAGLGIELEADTRAAVEAAARAFEAAGAIVEPMQPFITCAMLDGLDTFWRARAWADIGSLSEEAQDSILPYIHVWAEGGRHLTGAEVYNGMNQMMVMRHAAVAACRPYHFVISPVSPVPAYEAEFASPLDDPMQPFEHIGYTVAFNMSEQPASSVNAGYTSDGLPIGLQIVGQRFDDIGVMRLSRAFEELRGPQRPWPVL